MEAFYTLSGSYLRLTRVAAVDTPALWVCASGASNAPVSYVYVVGQRWSALQSLLKEELLHMLAELPNWWHKLQSVKAL